MNLEAQQLIQSAGSGVDTSTLEADQESLMDKWNTLNAKVSTGLQCGLSRMGHLVCQTRLFICKYEPETYFSAMLSVSFTCSLWFFDHLIMPVYVCLLPGKNLFSSLCSCTISLSNFDL